MKHEQRGQIYKSDDLQADADLMMPKTLPQTDDDIKPPPAAEILMIGPWKAWFYYYDERSHLCIGAKAVSVFHLHHLDSSAFSFQVAFLDEMKKMPVSPWGRF